MAEVQECVIEADLIDQNEGYGVYGKQYADEVKAIFVERAVILQPAVTQEAGGYVATYSSTSMVGNDDYHDQIGHGAPINGNFVKPKRFDWRLSARTQFKTLSVNNMISNVMSFRLIWMLVWQYPNSIDLGESDFDSFFKPTTNGDRLMSFLYPDVSEKCKVLYDCVHTMGTPGDRMANVYGNASAAAGGQAGYVVPAPSGTVGWVVPAATVPAISTAVASSPRIVYGGHQMFLSGQFDLEGMDGALWRNPQDLDAVQELVPALIAFVVTHAKYHYDGGSALPTPADRPQSLYSFSSRYTFSE